MSTTAMTRLGYALTGIFAAFLAIASIAPKLVGADVASDSMRQLGWPDGYVLTIGLIELACLALYLVPRTALLGAILMTGLLGGAIATQMRVENPLFTHTLFSVYLGLLMWGGLWLRDPSLRALIPMRGLAGRINGA
ncbi:DoxX family protein [Ferrovibrio sp.]|jgi:hypothetical protein|uniref:DoxX family protein n=1 Tax=Ferrovibrio sp. TaxID=1917215 RepID=UPI0035ADF3A6